MRATHHASRWLAAAGVLALGAGLWTPVASADSQGTIKIDGAPFDNHRDNEPHVCTFQVDLYGFEEGTEASLTFALQEPTGTEVIYGPDEVTLPAPGENGLNHAYDVDLSDELEGLMPAHVKLTVTAAEHIQKHKVFWVYCGGDLPGLGSVTVSKDVTGSNAPAASTEFGFRLAGTHHSYDFVLVDGASWTMPKWALLLFNGHEVTLTETEAHGATTVTYRLNGDVVSGPVTFEIDKHEDVTIEVVNDFPAPYVPPFVPQVETTTTSTTTTSTTIAPAVLPTEVTQAPTTTAPPTTAAPAEVEGVQLARTGGVNTTLLLVGALLVLQGVALELTARRLHR